MAKPAPDDRKTAILDSAVRVIIDIGFTEMTVADVARRADVSTALVHYHFSSKSDLVAAALARASDEDKVMREALARSDDAVVARLDAVLCGSMPSDSNDASWLLWIEAWGETRRVPEIRTIMADLDAHERMVLAGLIADGVDSEVLVCPDPAGVVERLVALRDGLAIQQTLFGTDRAPEDFRAVLRDAIAEAVGVPVDAYRRAIGVSHAGPRP